MTAKEILGIVLEFAGDNWGWGLVLFLSFVEVSKIKINPWTKLFNWLGNLIFSGIRAEMASMKTDTTKEISAMKSEVTKKISDVQTDVTKEVSKVKDDVREVKTQMNKVKEDLGEMKDESREDKAKAARNRILICADEVYQGVRHSKEYFDNILADITFYNNYCREHPEFKNDMTVMAVQRIEEVYKHCLETHGFL